MEKKTKATEVKKDAALKESFADIKKVATTVSTPVAKAAEAKKDVPAKKETPVKKDASKPAAKKVVKKDAPAKKESTKSTEPVTNVTLQINGKDIDLARVQADAVKAALKVNPAVKDVHVYVNANESAAYYTLDGIGKSEYCIKL